MDRYTRLQQRLNKIEISHSEAYLKDSLTGIEKECLRVSDSGRITQTNHPLSLGSTLTHPWITTDYSEAMLEFITPPLKQPEAIIQFLQDIHTYVYQRLDHEYLWTNSMPCIISAENDIRIAEYGQSNAGLMKHVYRQGLAHRYGKMMQVISGIHFNHSIAENFWPIFHSMEQSTLPLKAFIDHHYMGQVRNLLRYGWMIPYLFGASPAICQTFLSGIPTPENMELLGKHTYYEPKGTSLRMGDIGYTNNQEHKAGIHANYNSLNSYTTSLRKAIKTPYPPYEAIGVSVNGHYKQLNANILQIENEYYSTVRPKQIVKGLEKPIDALDKRGIRYVELRSIDINPMSPTGITTDDIYFLEVFMLFCLLLDSPKIDSIEQSMIQKNHSRVAHQGRLAHLLLKKSNSDDILLKHWLDEIFQQMKAVADLLDKANETDLYSRALAKKKHLIHEPDLTPSAGVLSELRQTDNFFIYAKNQSLQHRDYFLQCDLSEERLKQFNQMGEQSRAKLAVIEASSDVDFDDFLDNYFA